MFMGISIFYVYVFKPVSINILILAGSEKYSLHRDEITRKRIHPTSSLKMSLSNTMSSRAQRHLTSSMKSAIE